MSASGKKILWLRMALAWDDREKMIVISLAG